jgi:GNAT superfamily N-acetyltransferase
MAQHSIILRAANPTFDEGLMFARHLAEAAEGFFRLMLGGQTVHILAKAYTHPGHGYSHQDVIFAEHDEAIVGMALGFTAKQRRRFTDKPWKKAAGKHALRMTAVKALCAPLMRILNTIAVGDFFLLSIAIDKERRGESVGSALPDAIEERARDSGSTRLALDVAARDEEARRLHEHCGMTVESQWPKRLVVPGRRLFRMRKPL